MKTNRKITSKEPMRDTTGELIRNLSKKDLELLKNHGKIFLHDDHPTPVTRRDFLKTGLITFSGSMIAPQIVGLIGNNAYAQTDSGCTIVSSLPGFIHINMEGGFGLSGSFLAKNLKDKMRGGAPVPLNQINDETNLIELVGPNATSPAYRSVGLGNGRAETQVTVLDGRSAGAEKLFANPFPAVTGPDGNAGSGGMFFRRIREAAPNARLKTSCTAICVSSMDDSSTNKFGPQGMLAGVINQMNAKFQIYPNISNVNSPTNTGVRQVNASRDLRPMAPIIVDSAGDVKRILGIPMGGTEAGENIILSDGENKLTKELIDSLSQQQSRSISSVLNSLTEKFKNVFLESTAKNSKNATCPPQEFDPFQNPLVAPIWNNVFNIFEANQVGRGPQSNAIKRIISAAVTEVRDANGNVTTPAAAEVSQAGGISTLAYSGVQGFAGMVGISIGGYDYHGDTRQNQDRADSKAGAIIGGILETAHVLNKKVFIFVTSDGAVGSGSNNPFQAFTSDRGIGGSALCIMYDPVVDLTGVDTQLGYYTNGIGAADDTLVSAPERAAQAAFYRYLKFANIPEWQSMAAMLLKDNSFTTAELGYILGKIG